VALACLCERRPWAPSYPHLGGAKSLTSIISFAPSKKSNGHGSGVTGILCGGWETCDKTKDYTLGAPTACANGGLGFEGRGAQTRFAEEIGVDRRRLNNVLYRVPEILTLGRLNEAAGAAVKGRSQ
jgi:hypothetical protein